MSIQVKKVSKLSSSVKVSFDSPFENIPTVIVSPFWDKQINGVGYIPTITQITREYCVVTSENSATENYYVNVLAFDPESRSPIKNKKVIGGVVQKKLNGPLKVQYPKSKYLKSPDPATLLSPFWNQSSSGVDKIETLDDNTPVEIGIISNNKAPSNYYVNYFASDLGIGVTNSGNLMEAGIANKTASGSLRIYFTQVFDKPPVVSISPWYDDANSVVSYIETVINVTESYFEITSGNQASNYFVNWVAVQPE